MSKQERRAKAEKQADEQVAVIVEKAVEKVTRTRALSDEHAALGPKVKEYRDQGLAWWVIGFKLSLPGSADNVREGKSGASFARRIYAASFGEVPRTQARNGSRRSTERNEDVKALKTQRKTDRIEKVRQGEAVLRVDMTNEEVVETLRGRVISWSTSLASLSDKMGDADHLEQTAGVHRKWAKVEEHGGDRCLVFKEYDPMAPIKYRSYAGPTRIVRLREIHTVR